MKNKKTNSKVFFIKYKAEISLILIILLFPLLIGLLYHLPIDRIIEIESGDLLSFYGAAFGIFGSFIAYRNSKKKQDRQRETDNKPVFIVDVDKKNDYFKITISKQTDTVFTYYYLYDDFMSKIIPETYSVKVSYNKSDEEFRKTKCDYNITMDPEIIDIKDGYPKYIQILCEDADRYTWNCEYHKINDCGKIYYYPRVIEVL